MKYDSTRHTFRSDDDRWHSQSHYGNNLQPLASTQVSWPFAALAATALLLSTVWLLLGSSQ